MTSNAESVLLARYGWPIEEEDFGREDEPDVVGCALLEEVEGGTRGKFVVRPGLDEENRTGFAEWAVQKVGRFLELGPVADGWQERSDGAWQLWVRRVEMPPV
ncbi:hypothetical protein [Streptomyces drozdowiczii]|uniref:hypothetical protein n=1 Tax=Streptomyces drozdowiczii TaxID=202862 RepID=UPI00403C15B2